MMNHNDQPDQQNNNKVFVGNLPFSFTQGQLEETFAEFGQIVSANLITDRMTGRPKGFAFVEFDNAESAQKAIDAVNGKKIGERDVVVNIAKPRQPREFGGGFNNRGGGNRSFGGPRRDDRRY